MDPTARCFTFERPDSEKPKDFVMLCRTDRVLGAVQVVRRGGETNLHSHPNLDGIWYVLKGRARFYTTGDEVIGDLGANEGVLIPRGYPYWFEAVGDDELHVLQVEASTKPMPAADGIRDFSSDRVDHAPRVRTPGTAYVAPEPPAGGGA